MKNQKKGQLTPELKQEIVELVIETYNKEIESQRKRSFDKRLYNTRLLMEKYRNMMKYVEDAVYDAKQLTKDFELQTLLETMTYGSDSYSFSVESIKERVGKTRIILDHVTKMLDYYRFRCESSNKQETMCKWETIRYLYLDKDEKSVQDLAKMYHVDERTVYRYNRAALQDLSALFFGWVD